MLYLSLNVSLGHHGSFFFFSPTSLFLQRLSAKNGPSSADCKQKCLVLIRGNHTCAPGALDDGTVMETGGGGERFVVFE